MKVPLLSNASHIILMHNHPSYRTEKPVPSRDDIGLDILNEIQTEYKPLAKVEELEEQNYNRIDNVLDNTKPKKAERPEDRPSLRERLRSGRMKMEAEKRERNLLDPRHNKEKAI